MTTQLTIKDLVLSYRTPSVLCVVGDELPPQRYYWKMYAFLSKFVTPAYKVSDMEENLPVSLKYINDEMLFEINAQLKKYGLELYEAGGNLHLGSGTH